ncbi:restriction endonuclease subunit S [Salmonella enterica subsp. enterica serovar Enteritidis]|nr:restriction endonuclease subunit S [Salmonella enterica subsp. enterica serovar Enteritidis]
MRMSKQKREVIPELRFPEFEHEPNWSCAKLSVVAKRSICKNRGEKISRVLTNSAVDGVMDQRDYFEKDIAVKGNLESYFVVDNGDYVYNPRISLAAPAGPISKNKVGKGVMSPLYTVFRFNSENNDFFEQFFKSPRWHGYLQKVSNNGARHDRMSVTNKEFMAMPVPNPSDVEQQKIANFLASIDELITLHTQKYNTLKSYKKGLMRQLFPAEGETEPKIRFPEFSKAGPWKLKPVGSVFTEKQRPINMQDEAEYSLVTVKRRYGGLVSRGIYKGKSIKVKSQFEVHENDFLISKRQIVHCACGIVPKELERSIVSNEYAVLVPRNGNDVHFLNYFVQQPSVSQSFMQCSIGIVIEKMVFKLKDWLQEEFLFPELEEQKKISQFLGRLNFIIDEQSKKVDFLKEYKYGLMQKIFPAMDEVL